MTEQHHRHTELAHFCHLIFDIVEEVLERMHVRASSTGLTEAAQVDGDHIESFVREKATNVFVTAAVLGDAVNHQHNCPR